MQFENLTIHFSNLNIGYDGMGPGCLVQILAELGMDKDSMAEVVKKSRSELSLAGNVITAMR